MLFEIGAFRRIDRANWRTVHRSHVHVCMNVSHTCTSAAPRFPAPPRLSTRCAAVASCGRVASVASCAYPSPRRAHAAATIACCATEPRPAVRRRGPKRAFSRHRTRQLASNFPARICLLSGGFLIEAF